MKTIVLILSTLILLSCINVSVSDSSVTDVRTTRVTTESKQQSVLREIYVCDRVTSVRLADVPKPSTEILPTLKLDTDAGIELLGKYITELKKTIKDNNKLVEDALTVHSASCRKEIVQ